MNKEQHKLWMEDYLNQPRIWWIEYPYEGTFESTGNYYESKEAAEFELRFLERNKRRPQIRSVILHSLDLSRRRWTT